MTDTAVKAWRVATDSLPAAVRSQTWRQTLDRLRLPVANMPDRNRLAGEAVFLRSPLGTEVSRIAAGPHEFLGSYDAQPDGVWLSLLLEGEAQLFSAANTWSLTADDVVFAPTGLSAHLRFNTSFRQLFVKVPTPLLGSPACVPDDLRVLRLGAEDGMSQVFLSMLRELGQNLHQVRSEELRPVEQWVREFLIGRQCLEHVEPVPRAATLQRIRKTIELRLGDPELSLEHIAALNGVSTRYLQKLFAEQHDTFRAYRLRRRLERARADIQSPVCADHSITEICFRWGFNDPAHFSRSFSKAYGLSPRACRERAMQLAQELTN